MFGYFKFYKQYSNKLVCQCYKNYYCGLCFALEQNYGQLSRLLLSYDITLLSIIVATHNNPSMDRFKCFGKQNEKNKLFTDEEWKKIAAIDILLASKKLEDDINDEKSLKAKIGKRIFRKSILKAKNDYNEIYEIIRDGYKKIQEDELNDASLYNLSNDFSKLMTNILINSFNVQKWQLEYVSYISKWLYFIDALDDLDEDIKKGRFNPLREYKSSEKLINTYYYKINEFFETIHNSHIAVFQRKYKNSFEDIILESFLNNTIPITTERIMTKI